MTTVTLAVNGMTCPTCETSIEGALRRILKGLGRLFEKQWET